jgi:hypothetical protein
LGGFYFYDRHWTLVTQNPRLVAQVLLNYMLFVVIDKVGIQLFFVLFIFRIIILLVVIVAFLLVIIPLVPSHEVVQFFHSIHIHKNKGC